MTTYYNRRLFPTDTKYIVHPHYANEYEASNEAIGHQPYRTTPLILPGAKVKKEFAPTECYLRHHPNPAMRGRAPHVDENFLRQKAGDSVLHRVIGDAGTGKVAHKQFNSPIGLYSDNNIEHTIRTTVPNSTPFKRTVAFDPSKSDTYRAVQEDHYGNNHFGNNVHEIPITVQHQTYQPKGVAGKKPHSNYQAPPSQNFQNYYF